MPDTPHISVLERSNTLPLHFGVERAHRSISFGPMPSPSSLEQPRAGEKRSAMMITEATLSELKAQRGIALPMVATNLTWVGKIAITTAFLGRLGELELAGGALGFTFANVTGFSVLNGLCCAMEPLCGQAHGANNFRLLHKTLVMATLLLLAATLPISALWVYADKILIHFGQQEDISVVARNYLVYLLPDLVLTSFLCPIKTYLSSQGVTIPSTLGSAAAVALHIPTNILLSRAKGLQGVAMSVWMTDLAVLILLCCYVLFMELVGDRCKGGGGWWEQTAADWAALLRICVPCCLTTCLEWWCYEILVLLTGRLHNARQSVSILVIVLNFDYLLYAVMLSLATSASTRVSNELGAGRPGAVRLSARVSLAVAALSGGLGGAAMAAARGVWGRLFSHEEGVVRGVREMMLVMAAIEVVNFPVTVCGGVIRGTARPTLAVYANLVGVYAVALPVGVGLGFGFGVGLVGLLAGLLVGMVVCLVLLLVFVVRIDWAEEAKKAQLLARGAAGEVVQLAGLEDGRQRDGI